MHFFSYNPLLYSEINIFQPKNVTERSPGNRFHFEQHGLDDVFDHECLHFQGRKPFYENYQ